MSFRFGDFVVDIVPYSLSRAGQVVPVRPKVFDLLCYLIEHRERVVTKQELLEALWRGQHVDEFAVPWTVSHTRRALGHDSGAQADRDRPAAARALLPRALAVGRVRRPKFAETSYEYARRLFHRKRKTAALAFTRRALALSEQLGMQAVARNARALLESTNARVGAVRANENTNN